MHAIVMCTKMTETKRRGIVVVCKMKFILQIILVCVTLSSMTFELSLTGSQDKSAVINSDVVITCNLVSNGSVVTNVSNTGKSFTVTWTVTGVNNNTAVEVLRLTGDGQSEPKVVLTTPSKYQQGPGISLMVRNVSLTDAGTYTCQLESDKLTAELYVMETPQCHNIKTTLYVNEEGTFDCSVKYHGIRPPEMTLEHDSFQLNSSLNFQNDSYVLSKVKFKARVEIDGFVYRCHTQFPNTESIYTCVTDQPLNVLYPVQQTSISLSPYATIYDAGTDISLRCNSRGEPHPHFQWNFTPVGNSSKSIVLTRLSLYKIRNAHANNAGTYTCAVTNTLNGTTFNDSSTMFLRINGSGSTQNNGEYGVPFGKVTTQPDDKEISLSPYAVGALVTGTLAMILIAVFIVMAMKFRAREKRYHERYSRAHDEQMDDQEQVLLDENIQPCNVNDSEPQYGRMRQYWEIPRRDVRLMDLIATGSYCEVWRGRMRKNPDTNDIIRVTIKKVLDETSEQGRKFFLAEMEVLKMIKTHPNIICLIGCYTLNEPWLLMLEYAHEGTLLQYLLRRRQAVQEVEIHNTSQPSVRLKNNKIDSQKLLILAAQVAYGLQHLTKFKLIYYRLSASSVLVSKGGICKLSGFGFGQYVTERNLYEKESLPVRWMAPESIGDNTYSMKSDVWSYGILFWEILHFGMKPYPGMDSEEVVEEVLSGYRMGQPQHCSNEIYAHLLQCWKEVPENRPSYKEILHSLKALTENHSAHVVLEDLPHFSSSETDVTSDSM